MADDIIVTEGLTKRFPPDIIAVDLCKQIDTVPYPMSTSDDLADTVKQVEALDRRIVASEVDVRDGAALRAAVDEGVAQLGRLDIVAVADTAEAASRFPRMPQLALALGYHSAVSVALLREGKAGTPIISSRWRWVFHANVPTRSPNPTPSVRSAFARRVARRATSPYV